MPFAKGFTLIELLIVIVLIGIISSMTMLSIGSGNLRDQQRQEAERLLQLLQLASQEAIIRSMPVGLEFFQHSYRFMMMDNTQWQTEQVDALFKARTLHSQLIIKLQVDKQPVLLRDQANAKPIPQIIFTPDGDISLFQLKIALNDSDQLFIVTNTFNNGLAMVAQTNASVP